MKIYCAGVLSVVRYLGGGWAHCLRCGDRVRVVK